MTERLNIVIGIQRLNSVISFDLGIISGGDFNNLDFSTDFN